jgi:hypothetical protein
MAAKGEKPPEQYPLTDASPGSLLHLALRSDAWKCLLFQLAEFSELERANLCRACTATSEPAQPIAGASNGLTETLNLHSADGVLPHLGVSPRQLSPMI